MWSVWDEMSNVILVWTIIVLHLSGLWTCINFIWFIVYQSRARWIQKCSGGWEVNLVCLEMNIFYIHLCWPKHMFWFDTKNTYSLKKVSMVKQGSTFLCCCSKPSCSGRSIFIEYKVNNREANILKS